MNVLFVGLGSIGEKHLRDLFLIANEKKVSLRVDAVRTSNPDYNPMLSKTYPSVESVDSYYDVIFITNPTYLHHDTLVSLFQFGKYFFIEKPIFHLVYKDFLGANNIYVACPLRYHPVIKHLKTFTLNNKVISFRAICSTFLPNWPSRNRKYQDYYSSHRNMGGGVELDLIHEIDYIRWVFGNPISIESVSGKVSNLEIDSNDVGTYVLRFNSLIGSLHIDYFGRYRNGDRREIEIFTNEDVILFDLKNNLVASMQHQKKIDFASVDIYKKEIENFLDFIEGKKSIENTINDAVETLSLALGKLPNF